MSEKYSQPATVCHLGWASVGNGRDWAALLAQAHPAPPFGTTRRGGQPPAGAWAALVQLARREGFAAARGDCADGDAFTSWRDRRIHVRRDATPAQAVISLAHQIGHVLLHAEIAYLGRSGDARCEGTRKLEADSAAYLVAAHLGLDAPDVRCPRVASWARTWPRDYPTAVVQAVVHRVLAAAATITSHLDAALTEATPSTPQDRDRHPNRGQQTGHVQAGSIPTKPSDPTAAEARDSRAGGTSSDVHTGGSKSGLAQSGRTGPSHPRATRSRDAGPRTRGGQLRAASYDTSPDAAAAADGPPVPHSQLARVHQAAARFFGGRLEGSWVPGYLTGRGFGPIVQRRWQVGYAPPGPDTLTRHLRALGYPDAVIEAAGLARRSWRGTLADTFRERAVLPIRTSDGTIIAFTGRRPPGAGPDVPKYINSPATQLYTKSDVLFGLHEAHGLLTGGAQPVIVEGPFDAIAVTTAGAGRYAGVAPCGTALTAHQAAALGGAADLPATGVLVAFDADPAGKRAAIKAYKLLSPLTGAITAAVLPAGHDPAQILAAHGPAALAQQLGEHTVPLADLVTDSEVDSWSRWLQYAEGQINALHATAPVIAAMPPDDVGRQVARLAHRLGLDYPTVTDAVTSALHDLPADCATSSRRSAASRKGR